MAWKRWYNAGHHKVSKGVYGGMFNVWPGTNGIIESIVKHPNELTEVCLMWGLQQIV
jgi:hypothetical protein